MKRLLSYMKKYRAATALAVFCIVLETFLELIIPLIMADMVDVGIANGDKAYIFEKGLMMAVCAVISMVLGVGSARFAAVCGQGVGAEIRKNEYRKLQQFSFANTDRFRTSSLVTRLTGDVTNIQNSGSPFIPYYQPCPSSLCQDAEGCGSGKQDHPGESDCYPCGKVLCAGRL